VLRDMGKDWEIIELDLDPPREGEVLIRFAAAGLCHSDDHLRTGRGQPRCRFAAEPPGAAGDQGHLAVKAVQAVGHLVPLGSRYRARAMISFMISLAPP